MPEFLNLLPPSEALAKLAEHLVFSPVPDEIETIHALGRVTVSSILAPHPLPAFPRSTVDGFAVRAADTYGASESLPAYLQITGEVAMGQVPDFSLSPARCALIHTGGMLPMEADAVVMVEYTQSVRPSEIEILRAVAVGENVLKIGEDVSAGQEIIQAGVRLRPPDIGGLMALGITRVQVSKKPRVGIISSGDEIVSPEMEIQPGQVRDINSYTLSTLVEQAGGIPLRFGIVPDKSSELQEAARLALSSCELLVITAGSSASARDLTAEVIDSLGEPGVLVHGVEVRPGKPTILAACGRGDEAKAVIGLPGNPVSALVIGGLFVIPIVDRLLGLIHPRPRLQVRARLSLNLPSQAGREDWIPVRLVGDEGEYVAEPVFGKSNLIFTLARADGLIRIPPAATGLSAGELVNVLLLT
jgi:molybdopterin molybdotransferase